MKKYCRNGSGIDDKILLKWKRYWWKLYRSNGSGIDEQLLLKWKRDWKNNIPEIEAKLIKNIAEMEAHW